MTDLATELTTLVRRYGTHVLEDADGLRATLDDFLDEGVATPGDINLLIDAVRFGSLERLSALIDQGADPAAAAADVAAALAQQRGGDAQSAYWACALLGHAAGLVANSAIPLDWGPPSSAPALPTSSGSTSAPAPDSAGSEETNRIGPPGDRPLGGRSVPPRSLGRHAGVGDGPGGDDQGKGRAGRRPSWAVAGVAAVAAVLVSVGVYVSTRPDTPQMGGRHDVVVADVNGPFDHFGDNFVGALNECVNAAVGGTYEEFNCSFKPPYDAFELELTEKDPSILNADGQLPPFVRQPARNTIVTINATEDHYHAYVLTWQDKGVDGVKNTGDDEVRSTLYDVDPDHPGAAIFTATDSTKQPLTYGGANALLRAIGFNTAKFSLPTALTDSSLVNFARRAPDYAQFEKSCVPSFTDVGGEVEQDKCMNEVATPGHSVTLYFGTMDSGVGLVPPRRHFIRNSPDAVTWRDGLNRTGMLFTYRQGNARYLYWDDSAGRSWGLMSTDARPGDRQALLDYFKTFAGNPRTQ